jgi:son of sevenless
MTRSHNFCKPCTLAAPAVHTLGQSVVAWLHSVLSFFLAINLARTVDVDGIKREGQAGDVYLQSVHKARTLVRTAEAYLQSLYDDGASLLLIITTATSSRIGLTSAPCERVRSLAASLKNNVVQAFQTLEALLAVGQEQAVKGPSDFRRSIEWRASRIPIGDLEGLVNGLTFEDDSNDEGGDFVDMVHVFGRKTGPRKPSAKRSPSPAALYSNPSQTSESSLEPPHAHVENGTPLPSQPTNNTPGPPSPASHPGSEGAVASVEDEGNRSSA